jgi:hypothetical protein
MSLHQRIMGWIPSQEFLKKVGISQIEEGPMATYESERGGRRRPFRFKQSTSKSEEEIA